MDITALDYELPLELIAQTPAARRDESRLMVVDRATRRVAHAAFREIGGWLPAGSLLVRNNARVLPARLRARRPGGGSVECLLLHPSAADTAAWWCLLRPGRKLKVGDRFGLAGAFQAKVEEVDGEGKRLVRFETAGDSSVIGLANRVGEMPLPPYIRRGPTDQRLEEDRVRYQTIYAREDRPVAVAAPTAGLHFTRELISSLAARGHRFADLTLHVGAGTFQPIKTSVLEDHRMHRELYEIPPETVGLLRAKARPLVAVGTTSVRAVEDFLSREEGPPNTPDSDFVAEAGLYLYPPARFAGVNALITNFHLPRSSLLCLVGAFLDPGGMEGLSWLRQLYAEAVEKRYRFYSYGDAMLIL